jgi:hypothetical protein
VTDPIYLGNADADAPAARGWLLGHFIPAGNIRHSSEVEIKWGVHARGEQRAQWVSSDRRTTVIVLISGRFRVELPDSQVVLARRGDYVVFRTGGHSWQAEQDSVVLGIRWPSVPGYAVGNASPPGAGEPRGAAAG